MFCWHHSVSAATRCGWIQDILPIPQGAMAKATSSHIIAVAACLFTRRTSVPIYTLVYSNAPIRIIPCMTIWGCGRVSDGRLLIGVIHFSTISF